MRKLVPTPYVPPESHVIAAYRQKREAQEAKARLEAERAAKKADRMGRNLTGTGKIYDDPFEGVSKEELVKAHKQFAKHFYARFGTVLTH